MKFPHYFMALPLPAFLKDQFAEWQRALKPELPYKQWVHPDDLHITLKFLGPVDGEQLEVLKVAMQKIENLNAFTLRAGTLGTFGNPKKPRVLWAGVEQKEALFYLQREVEHICVQSGFQYENRPYTPHITLAKKWTGGTIDMTELKNCYKDNGSQTFRVKQVILYQIQPDNKPKYSAEDTFDLVYSNGQ